MSYSLFHYFTAGFCLLSSREVSYWGTIVYILNIISLGLIFKMNSFKITICYSHSGKQKSWNLYTKLFMWLSQVRTLLNGCFNTYISLCFVLILKFGVDWWSLLVFCFFTKRTRKNELKNYRLKFCFKSLYFNTRWPNKQFMSCIS